ncbi:hypothetical protein TL16_g04781 [Triparma laevis f. inornata]|nr:hypothetical protein TL16_g04781 [Triparma laevis f. inornata]
MTKFTNFNLEDCWKQKPVVDGKTLQTTLNLGKGPEVGKWMKKVVEFMLVNEGGSKEQCIEYLKECKEREMEVERGMEVEVDKKVDEGVK